MKGDKILYTHYYNRQYAEKKLHLNLYIAILVSSHQHKFHSCPPKIQFNVIIRNVKYISVNDVCLLLQQSTCNSRPATHTDLIGISRFFSTNLGGSRFFVGQIQIFHFN